MKYYKFLRRGTYNTLVIGTELPPPGQPSLPISNIQPSGSAGPNSGVGYHVYTEGILPYITGNNYNTGADLWVVQVYGQTIQYYLVSDKPSFVLPPRPMKSVVAESIELIEKVPFIVSGGRLHLL